MLGDDGIIVVLCKIHRASKGTLTSQIMIDDLSYKTVPWIRGSFALAVRDNAFSRRAQLLEPWPVQVIGGKLECRGVYSVTCVRHFNLPIHLMQAPLFLIYETKLTHYFPVSDR